MSLALWRESGASASIHRGGPPHCVVGKRRPRGSLKPGQGRQGFPLLAHRPAFSEVGSLGMTGGAPLSPPAL